MLPEYADADTGAPLNDGALERRYLDYVDSLQGDVPDVQPCSFNHWLRGEITDGYIKMVEV